MYFQDTRECEANNHTTTTTTQPHQQPQKGWRFVPDAILPGHRRAHSWVLARTPTVHQCLCGGRPQVAPLAYDHEHDARRRNVHGHATPRIPFAHSGGGVAAQDRRRQAREAHRVRQGSARQDSEGAHSCDWEDNTANDGLHCPSHQRADCRERR